MEFMDGSRALAEADLSRCGPGIAHPPDDMPPKHELLQQLDNVFSDSTAIQEFIAKIGGDTDAIVAVAVTMADLLAKTEMSTSAMNCAGLDANTSAMRIPAHPCRSVALALFASSVHLKLECVKHCGTLVPGMDPPSLSARAKIGISPHWMQRELCLAVAVLQSVCNIGFPDAVDFVASNYQRGVDAAVIFSVLFLSSPALGASCYSKDSSVTSLTVFSHWLEALLEPSMPVTYFSKEKSSGTAYSALSGVAQECEEELVSVDMIRSPVGDIILRHFFYGYRESGELSFIIVIYRASMSDRSFVLFVVSASGGAEPEASHVDAILRGSPGIDAVVMQKSGRSALHFACAVSN
jgi:hypothetical protein